MTAPYAVEALANTILAKAEEREISVDPMKLQKLMYLSHGYYLGKRGVPLSDEEFQAWQYGPVSATIYHEFKQHGSQPFRSGARATRIDFSFLDDNDFPDTSVGEPYVPNTDEMAHKVVNFVLNVYGERTGIYLSDLTHKDGSPWEIARRENPGRRNVSIRDRLIEDYFRPLSN